MKVSSAKRRLADVHTEVCRRVHAVVSDHPDPDKLTWAITGLFLDAADHLYPVESPIEELFRAAFLPKLLDPRWIMATQQTVIGYRVDFTISRIYGDDVVDIVVECDGHDFHEKTKEQAARDKRRDRDLAAEGWTVLRFTGSELWADPFACVQDVVAVALREKVA